MHPNCKKFYLLLLLMSISGLTKAQKKKAPDVLIKKAFVLPVAQLSGLAIYEELNAKSFKIFAIGDEESRVQILRWVERKPQKRQDFFNFDEQVNKRFLPCTDLDNEWCASLSKTLNRDWEAIQIDGRGSRFILQEQSGLVLVLDKLNRYEADIRLDYRPLYPAYEKKTGLKAQRDSLAEGLVLMKNGHLLIVYQENPVLIVEYGPKGKAAHGLNKESFLSRVEPFKYPSAGKSHDYMPLKFWSIPDLENCDLNELVWDTRNSRLLTLSKDCRKVYALKAKGTDTLGIAHSWKIPKKIRAIEGLAVLPNGQWLIASDLAATDKKNVRLVSPMIKISKKKK